jgi:hypothetical protein
LALGRKVIAFAAFDVVRGFDCEYLLFPPKDMGLDIRAYNDLIKLNEGQLIMPRGTTGFVALARCDSQHGLLTWIGRYKPTPTNLSSRSGDHFGVGIWLLSSKVEGGYVLEVLEEKVNILENLMQASDKHSWDVRRLSPSALLVDNSSFIHETQAHERPLPAVATLATIDTAFQYLDVPNQSNKRQRQAAIETLQEKRFSKILLPFDELALKAVLTRGRGLQVTVQELDELSNYRAGRDPNSVAPRYASPMLSETRPDPDPHFLFARQQTLDERLTRLAQELQNFKKRILNVGLVGGGGSILALAVIYLVLQLTWEPSQIIPPKDAHARWSPSGPAGEQRAPSSPSPQADGLGQSPNTRPDAGSSTGESGKAASDSYLKLQQGLDLIRSFVDENSTLSDDARRRMQLSVSGLVDAMSKVDAKVRPNLERLRDQTTDLQKAKLKRTDSGP